VAVVKKDVIIILPKRNNELDVCLHRQRWCVMEILCYRAVSAAGKPE
jgi:hypothetical protein